MRSPRRASRAQAMQRKANYANYSLFRNNWHADVECQGQRFRHWFPLLLVAMRQGVRMNLRSIRRKLSLPFCFTATPMRRARRQPPPLAQPCSRVVDLACGDCGRAVFVESLKRQDELSVVSGCSALKG